MSGSRREVISIHIGQAGIQMGASLWEQYCKEHKIGLDGVRKRKKYRAKERLRKGNDGTWETVPEYYDLEQSSKKVRNRNFSASYKNKETKLSGDVSKLLDVKEATIDEKTEEKMNLGKIMENPDIRESWVFFSYNNANDTHTPRALHLDLEPNVIDAMMASDFGSLFRSSSLLKGNEDAANNFARGRYTIGKNYLDAATAVLRKEYENCDNCQGLVFNMSVGGGTGSGYGGLLAQYCAEEYKKTPQLSFAIYPSETLSTCIVEPYNALLSTHDLIEFNNISCAIDNEAGYHLCQKKLKIDHPNFFNINRLVGKVASSVTSGLRFSGEQQFTVADMLTNLVPFPRLHFMTCAMAPIMGEEDVDEISEDKITRETFRSDHMFMKYYDWDIDTDRYMGISLVYRGNVVLGKCQGTIQKLKNNTVKLVEWCPTGFKVSLVDRLPSYLGDDGLKPVDRSVVMIGNNTAISRPLSNRILKKYEQMYAHRAYVHWYVGEGMEEGEFQEAAEDLSMLVEDYTRTNSENPDTDYVGNDAENPDEQSEDEN